MNQPGIYTDEEPDPAGEEIDAPCGSFREVAPTTQAELDQLDPDYREVD